MTRDIVGRAAQGGHIDCRDVAELCASETVLAPGGRVGDLSRGTVPCVQRVTMCQRPGPQLRDPLGQLGPLGECFG